MAPSMVKPLGIASVIGMWIVLVMGATVTNTGSQTGCGPSWPLCRGRFIPQMAVSTAIEFSHRSVVAVESVLIIAFAITAWIMYAKRAEVRILVPAMVFFLFLQAGLGAWAVMSPQNAAVLALHFGVSLIAFASVVLATCLVLDLQPSGARWDKLREIRVPAGLMSIVWGLTVFTYLVVYLGAYARHSKADDGCEGWPLCNGAVIPSLHGPVVASFAHRAAAAVLVLGTIVLLVLARRARLHRPDLWLTARIVCGLVLLQGASGALVAWTDADLFSALAHAGIVAVLFAALCYACLRAMPRPAYLPSGAVASSTPLHAGAYEVEGAPG